jgi:hypothetical protein
MFIGIGAARDLLRSRKYTMFLSMRLMLLGESEELELVVE